VIPFSEIRYVYLSSLEARRILSLPYDERTIMGVRTLKRKKRRTKREEKMKEKYEEKE
jgi:hypothetical protein